jgi:hypothetical protein
MMKWSVFMTGTHMNKQGTESSGKIHDPTVNSGGWLTGVTVGRRYRSQGSILPSNDLRAILTMHIVRYLAPWKSMKSMTDSKAPRARTDGRRTLLVYMDAALIKELKKAALDHERNVYEIVEEAARDWLYRAAGKKGAALSTSKTSLQRQTKATRSVK